MKLAVTSTGKTLEDAMDLSFGRAKYFLVVDTESGEIEVVDNTQVINVPQGAGIQAARQVVEKGVEAVASGNFGPNAFRALGEAGVGTYVSRGGKVEDVIAAFKDGKLQKVDDATIEGHWV